MKQQPQNQASGASETTRFFVVSNIFHQPFGIAPEGLFFCRRAVWSGGFFISLSGGGVALYINGTHIKSANYAPTNTANALFLGKSGASNTPFPGWMDEMRLRAAPSDVAWVSAN